MAAAILAGILMFALIIQVITQWMRISDLQERLERSVARADSWKDDHEKLVQPYVDKCRQLNQIREILREQP